MSDSVLLILASHNKPSNRYFYFLSANDRIIEILEKAKRAKNFSIMHDQECENLALDFVRSATRPGGLWAKYEATVDEIDYIPRAVSIYVIKDYMDQECENLAPMKFNWTDVVKGESKEY